MTESAISAGTSAPAPVAAAPKLGLFDTTMLVAGAMIGSGIFIVSAEIARDVGSSGWLLLTWILTGVLTVIGALSYAELASMMPSAGGQYVFLREAYGPLWGFLYGWTYFLVIQTGLIAAVSVAFAKYLGVLLPEPGTAYPLLEYAGFEITSGQLVAVAVAVILAVVNSFGLEQGRWVQNVFTVAKTFGLALLIVLGLTVAANSSAIQQNFDNVWDGIIRTETFLATEGLVSWAPLTIVLVMSGAMVGPLFSADAWYNVTFIAHEVKDPRRTLPWGLFLGTTMVILLYILANVAYMTALPVRGEKNVPAEAEQAAFRRGIDHAKQDRVATAMLEEISPRFGVPIMAVLIMISTFGCVNGLTLMGARLYYAMACDGLFFQAVGRLNRHGVPGAALLFQCVWSIVLIFSGTYSQLLDYLVFGALVFYIATVAAVFVLRRTMPDAPRPYRAWGYPLLPILYLLLCAVIMLSLLVVKPLYCWPSFIIVLSGIPVYFLWRWLNPVPATINA
jgi:APA family basic amino acid/polyamine antiporter